MKIGRYSFYILLRHYGYRFLWIGILMMIGHIDNPSYANPSNDKSGQTQLLNIDFRAHQQKGKKEALVLLDLSSSQPSFNVYQNEQGLVVQLFDTQAKEKALYLLDVKDFTTLVDAIEVKPYSNHIALQIYTHQAFEYRYHLENTQLQLTLTPSKQPITWKKDNQPISINFQDISVRKVLQIMAEHHQFNLVVSDSVSGNISLRLDKVPWQQALDLILQIKGLEKDISGNVMVIAPKSELDAQQQRRWQQAQSKDQLEAVDIQLIPINYAKASTIASLIKNNEGVGLLSERGSVSIDERTNALLISDTPTYLQRIKSIVHTLDIPVKQVQIEARIVMINQGNIEDLGIRWGISHSNDSWSTRGSIESLYTHHSDENSEDGDSQDWDIGDFLNVNLGASNPNAASIAFQVAKLGSNTLLDLELSALQAESKAEIISNPRLITTNKQPAYIEQGTEIPYLEAASSGATSVSFKKAVLSLKVTPQITPDNKLVLDLNVTQDRPGAVVKTGEGEAVAIDTQRIGTQVLVEDGETIVLGGIYQHSVQKSTNKVPLLGDIPYLGRFFRQDYENYGKTELLIFVTPKVIEN